MRAHLAGAINFAGNFVKCNALAVDSDGEDRTFIEFRVRDGSLEFRHSFSSCCSNRAAECVQPGIKSNWVNTEIDLFHASHSEFSDTDDELGPSACAGNFPPIAIQVRENEPSNIIRTLNRV